MKTVIKDDFSNLHIFQVDRTGYQEFKKWALKDVNLPPKAEVSQSINW